jgi:hypothetical protein
MSRWLVFPDNICAWSACVTVCIAYNLAYGLCVWMGMCVCSVWTGVTLVCAQVVCAGSVEFVCFFESRKVRMVCRTFRNGFVEHWVCRTYRNGFLSSTRRPRPREGQTRLGLLLPRLPITNPGGPSEEALHKLARSGQKQSSRKAPLFEGVGSPPFFRGEVPSFFKG